MPEDAPAGEDATSTEARPPPPGNANAEGATSASEGGEKASSWNVVNERAGEILNVRAEVARRETTTGRVINKVGNALSHPAFFLTLLGVSGGWVVLNLPLWSWTPWDPYPFTFWATVMSATSPFIALLILMRQQHDRRISELREETTLQVLLYVEREMTASLRLAGQQRPGASGPPPDEEALRHLQEDLDPEHLLDHLRRRLDRIEGEDVAEERGAD